MTSLREIRDHSVTFDVDEIPYIARQALAEYEAALPATEKEN